MALAFGLTVLTGAYALGHISGAHFNPAVSLGLWAGGRFATRDLLPYVIAQVAGAILAGFVLLQIASGTGTFAIDGNAAGAFASNGYGAMSPGGYGVAAAFLCEVVLTAMFLVVGLALLLYGAGIAASVWAGVWFRRTQHTQPTPSP